MSHMVQVRNAMMAEAKSKPAQCRKIARMITAHWEREEGKEEREQQALEREQKKKARDIVRALKKKWGLAVKVRGNHSSMDSASSKWMVGG
jgi:helicase SWR1